MTQELYEKAAEQALRSAQEGGEIAPYCIGIGLALIAFGCYMYHLENANWDLNKSYFGGAVLGWLIGAVLLLGGLSCALDAHQANHNRELFLVKKLYKPEDRVHIAPCPVIIGR